MTLLHDELKTLGFSIPDKEIDEGVFGQGTEQVVKEFQGKHGLQMSGVVDLETAARINREGQGPGPDSAESFVVKGRVVHADGKALADGLLQAFDKDLRSEEFLGETTTDEGGRYTIHYNEELFSRAEQGSADLIVRAYAPDGLEELASSPILFNAQPEETIDLVVGGEVYRGPSEYDQLVKQLTPLLQGITFAELTEDEEHQDVTFLGGETGEDPFHITFLIAAHRLAERTDIAPEIFYGPLCNDLPPNLSALLVQDLGLVRRSLEMAAADNSIPARFAEGIDDLLARFRQLVVSEAVRPVGDGEEQAPLVTLLGTVLSDREQQAVTPADVLAKYADPIPDAIHRDMRDREFPDMCEAPRGGRSAGPFRWQRCRRTLADRPDHAPPDGRLCPAGCQRSRRLPRASQQ